MGKYWVLEKSDVTLGAGAIRNYVSGAGAIGSSSCCLLISEPGNLLYKSGESISFKLFEVTVTLLYRITKK